MSDKESQASTQEVPIDIINHIIYIILKTGSIPRDWLSKFCIRTTKQT